MMLEYLVIDHSDYIYVRLQGLIWVANGLNFRRLLEDNAGNLLCSIINNYRTEIPIIINCQFVVEIDDHALDKVFELIKTNKRQTIWLNVNQIKEVIDQQIKDYKIVEVDCDYKNDAFIFGSLKVESIKAIVKLTEDLEKKYINNVVYDCYRKFDSERRLYSTPFIASGFFDARFLVSKPKSFLWINLIMADYVERYLHDHPQKLLSCPSKLLAVSLRGSPFAAAISYLLNCQFDLIDHFGPKHKILDFDIFDNYHRNIRYIYIGDFIIGGTELKIAKTFAQSKGSTIEHAFSIGKLLESNAYDDDIVVDSLVNIRDIRKDLNYKVI